MFCRWGAEQRIGDNIRMAVAATEFAAAELENESDLGRPCYYYSKNQKKF